MIRDKDSRRREATASPSGAELEAENGAGSAEIPELGEEQPVGAPAEAAVVDATPDLLAQERERYLRLVAEFDNFRKRTNREKQEMGSRAQAALAALLLDSLDDLSRVTSISVEGADPAPIIQGVDLIGRKLTKVLSGAGLEALDPVDQVFDPNIHEAVSTQPAESPDDDGSIAAVFQRGYLFNGQLLRPARVVVRKWNG